MTLEHAPVLSTPAEHILEDTGDAVLLSTESRLSEEQLHIQFEISRTINEIRRGKWKRIALQFPDHMLVDAPRVFDALQNGLKSARQGTRPSAHEGSFADISNSEIQGVTLATNTSIHPTAVDIEERITILGDTSYGACCVDEVAAEHVDADVVVHYGRSCLSPTARLPVIYVYTSSPLDLTAAVQSFRSTYPALDEKVCLMADIPYSHHLDTLQQHLVQVGYRHCHKTNIIQDPTSLLPNRTIPADVVDNPECLKEYSIFHISEPPTSLLLILSSRVKSLHILPTTSPSSGTSEGSATQLLRRRYALVTRLSTVPIFGILINTLSVANYIDALQHCQNLIASAGKKSYTFVVGKVNAAKVANFSEIGGWVVIGCWESSLIESKDFFTPLITPFELEMALADDNDRIWGNEWVGDFSQLLERCKSTAVVQNGRSGDLSSILAQDTDATTSQGIWDDQASDDEPPEFDLRTGRYVSHSRPLGRSNRKENTQSKSESGPGIRPLTSGLVRRTKGDIATVGGQVSPAAEFLRSKRTWQGLGSDYEIMYERDGKGKIQGASIEEGRSGVAKAYTVGENDRS